VALADPLARTPLERGRVHALRGLIEMRHGIPDAAYHLLLDAAGDLAAKDPVGALESLVLAGEAATLMGDPRLTSTVGEIAARLSGPDTGAADQSMIALLTGLGKLFEGNWFDGSRLLTEVIDEHVSGEDFAHVLRAGRAAMYLGRLSEARALYAKAVIAARGTAAPGQLTPMLDRLAYIEMLMGRLADAEVHALEGLRLAGDAGLDAGIAVTSLAMIHAYRGEQAECRELADTALKVAQERQLKMIGAAAQWALGVLELAEGRPGEALERMLTIASDAQGHPGILRWATPDLVEAAVRSGRPEASAPAVARLEAWATASGLPVPATELNRCRGLLTSGDGAVEYLETALHTDAHDSRPVERARLQLLLGETLRRSRQRRQARTHLRASLETFDRLGMQPWAIRARSELRACGESVTKRDPADGEHLTPQELQIAQYAASGESNADIAAKLFLSRRTVEYHLAKVYTKTGVTSRRELSTSALLAV
jgi:DNA-binding CsgD family transcriptional regulator